jgi:hypothetical protein
LRNKQEEQIEKKHLVEIRQGAFYFFRARQAAQTSALQLRLTGITTAPDGA